MSECEGASETAKKVTVKQIRQIVEETSSTANFVVCFFEKLFNYPNYTNDYFIIRQDDEFPCPRFRKEF